MRELKFRVWRYCHSDNKFKFYYLDNLRITCNSGAGIVFESNDYDLSFFDSSLVSLSKNEVIQQFTGLTDKNGRYIYEGDIIENHNEIFEVIFKDGSFQGKEIKRKVLADHWFMGTLFWDTIIGNTLENPELLK